jgi:hypothetical protein
VIQLVVDYSLGGFKNADEKNRNPSISAPEHQTVKPRFEIFAGKTLIGHSELELGDAPMGVAEGRFMPSPAYATIQAQVIAARERTQDHLSLSARFAGRDLPAEGGVHILDYSAELGTAGLQVSLLGIGYSLYEQLFPEHVAAYKAKFSGQS